MSPLTVCVRGGASDSRGSNSGGSTSCSLILVGSVVTGLRTFMCDYLCFILLCMGRGTPTEETVATETNIVRLPSVRGDGGTHFLPYCTSRRTQLTAAGCARTSRALLVLVSSVSPCLWVPGAIVPLYSLVAVAHALPP